MLIPSLCNNDSPGPIIYGIVSRAVVNPDLCDNVARHFTYIDSVSCQYRIWINILVPCMGLVEGRNSLNIPQVFHGLYLQFKHGKINISFIEH